MPTEIESEMRETIAGQLLKIGEQIYQKDGYLFNPHVLKRNLNDLIKGRFSYPIFNVRPDYETDIEEQIKNKKIVLSSSNKDELNSQNFPAEGQKKRKKEIIVELLSFNSPVSYRWAISVMKVKGCRPATLRETIGALSVAEFIGFNFEFQILILGSKLKKDPIGDFKFPVVDDLGDEYFISLEKYSGEELNEYCRFAVVRE